MLSAMLIRRLSLATCLLGSVLFVSCGSHDEVPILVNESRTASAEGEAIYREAKAADAAGKTKKAIKLYDKMADMYPYAPSAPTARYRQAQLLDQAGEYEDAVEAYDLFLGRFPGSALYSKAFGRMESIIMGIVDGKHKDSLFGMGREFSTPKKVEMLALIPKHAPRSHSAAKAQFKLGEVYLEKEKYQESVGAFRELAMNLPDSKLAPEALFRVGEILLQNAERGNQNQANLDLSREAFNDYLIQYPGHSKNAEARKMIASLNKRELQRSFDIAEFYMKTNQPQSAKIYYQDIVKKTSSGKLHDKAKARLKEIGN